MHVVIRFSYTNKSALKMHEAKIYRTERRNTQMYSYNWRFQLFFSITDITMTKSVNIWNT